METSVAEIHGYPPRPEDFEEPLFPTRESRRAVADHLLAAPWLSRASDLARSGGRGGRAVRARREPVEVGESSAGGRVWVARDSGRGSGRKRARKAWVVETLARWREVGWWWDEDRTTDEVTVRVLLSGGTVADLARERSGEWFLVGVVD